MARRVVGGLQPLGTNRSRRLASSLLRVGERLPPVTVLPAGRSDLGAEGRPLGGRQPASRSGGEG